MSLAVGALSSCSKDMGFDENKDKNGVLARKEVDEKRCEAKCAQEEEQDKLNLKLNLPRQMSEASLYATEDEEEEEEDDEEKGSKGLDLGPQLSLKDQFEKDKVFIFFLSFFHTYFFFCCYDDLIYFFCVSL